MAEDSGMKNKVLVSRNDKMLEPLTDAQLETLSRKDLLILLRGEQSIRAQYEEHIEYLQNLAIETKNQVIELEGKYLNIKNSIYGKSSEKSKIIPKHKSEKKKKISENKVLLPSERYPNLEIIEKDIELVEPISCDCCQKQMEDSGMEEVSEYLTFIPRKYLIIRQKRHKYRCGNCHGSIFTVPSLPRIKQGSSYSDDLIIDVALSKYCDLIPMERYVSMALRSGVKGLPAQSLIELTHYLADFLEIIYKKLKNEISNSIILHADETPHNMLEGGEKSNWYLWGFSNAKTCYFEIHDTRSGDVASVVLKDSKCEYLVSDVYSGYNKAIKVTNDYRESISQPLIKNVYCNAHARRKFKESSFSFVTESEIYLTKYQEIYQLESTLKGKTSEEILTTRAQMLPLFEEIKNRAEKEIDQFSTKSSLFLGLNYFLKNYVALTLFIKNSELPIDNNSQERLLRSPVVGRKTWYGTHSIRGAQTAAILFSIVETCKLNQVNPRKYFQEIVECIHYKKQLLTPSEYKKINAS